MEAETWVFTVETGFEKSWDVDFEGLVEYIEDAAVSIGLWIS